MNEERGLDRIDKYERDRIEAEVSAGARRCCATNYCEVDEMCYCTAEEHAETAVESQRVEGVDKPCD